MRFAHFRLVGPIIAGLTLLVAGMATFAFFGISRIDTEARQSQETMVSHNVALWISDIEFSLTSWTIWDEAIDKIDNTFDFEWTDRNIGASLIGTSRTRFTAVLDHADKTIYSRTADEVKDREFFKRGTDAIVQESASLVAQVRAREAEARRNPKPGIPDQIATSRIDVLGQDAVLLSAVLFQPDFSTFKPKHDLSPILITAMPIAGSLPGFFGTRFMLDDARIGTETSVDPDRARVEVAVGLAGETEVLSWRPPQPATDALYRSLPLIVTVAVILLAGAIFLLRMSQTTAGALVAKERQMRHAATHDFLTGLSNRALLLEEYDGLAAKGPLAVVCLDLDGFKAVNDTHGHAMGDALLKVVAERLQQSTRGDDRLFRLGGDEFAILMPGLGAPEAAAACQRLSVALALPVELACGPVTIGASFGIRLVDDGRTSCDAALGAADGALYDAKAERYASALQAASPRRGGRPDTPPQSAVA
ncbi:MAG: diguanylate cyclase [Neorhizobium sp.]|nr:diguanylate cyclase [Neorhizobium sp.]